MILDDLLPDYCQNHSTPVQPLLQQLERETHLKTLYPQMLSGAYQGMLLQMISRMIRPQRVLEIGTFTGYGALSLAQGLEPGGCLHTIEIEDELAPIIKKYVGLAGLEDQIALHLGDAADVIPTLEEVFDLVFLDAGKLDYARHYEMVLPKIRQNGFLLADNVLWGGRVLRTDDGDASAEALRAFNAQIQADDRVENLLLPIRDGLMLIRKR